MNFPLSKAKSLWSLVIISFFLTSITPPAYSDTLTLPKPGTSIGLTQRFNPLTLKGVKVHPDNPILFDFILDLGESGLKASDSALKEETDRLVKYFLTALTIPHEDMWVNLSPYEKERVVPETLGQTAMGRDLLSQDYMLKQLSASLIHPDKSLGKDFWARVQAKAKSMYNTDQIPVNTFNKVWITADTAKVFVKDNTAFVVNCHLKVMMEEDYLAQSKSFVVPNEVRDPKAINISNDIFKSIILPEIEREVNEGTTFANLRQMFHGMILASWYKKNLKEALLTQVYADKSKTKGISVIASEAKQSLSPQEIYQQYIQAYKKGVFNLIKEEPTEQGATPRKYFSGGIVESQAMITPAVASNFAQLNSDEKGTLKGQFIQARVTTPREKAVGDKAMIGKVKEELVRLKAGESQTFLRYSQDKDFINPLSFKAFLIKGEFNSYKQGIIKGGLLISDPQGSPSIVINKNQAINEALILKEGIVITSAAREKKIYFHRWEHDYHFPGSDDTPRNEMNVKFFNQMTIIDALTDSSGDRLSLFALQEERFSGLSDVIGWRYDEKNKILIVDIQKGKKPVRTFSFSIEKLNSGTYNADLAMVNIIDAAGPKVSAKESQISKVTLEGGEIVTLVMQKDGDFVLSITPYNKEPRPLLPSLREEQLKDLKGLSETDRVIVLPNGLFFVQKGSRLSVYKIGKNSEDQHTLFPVNSSHIANAVFLTGEVRLAEDLSTNQLRTSKSSGIIGVKSFTYIPENKLIKIEMDLEYNGNYQIIPISVEQLERVANQAMTTEFPPRDFKPARIYEHEISMYGDVRINIESDIYGNLVIFPDIDKSLDLVKKSSLTPDMLKDFTGLAEGDWAHINHATGLIVIQKGKDVALYFPRWGVGENKSFVLFPVNGLQLADALEKPSEKKEFLKAISGKAKASGVSNISAKVSRDHLLLGAHFINILKLSENFDKAMTASNYRALKGLDRAMQSHEIQGGIDLNEDNLRMDVEGQADIKFDPAMIRQFQSGDFTGVRPVILGITVLPSIWPLFGMADPNESVQVAAI